MLNPFAPQAMNGINQPDDGGRYVDVDFSCVYETTPQLAALEIRRDQTVPIQNDADFILRAVNWTQPVLAASGVFRLRLSDSQGYYLSQSLIYQGNYSNLPDMPTPIMPEIIFPRGGQIGLDIENIDGVNPSLVQIVFRGVKRYRIAG